VARALCAAIARSDARSATAGGLPDVSRGRQSGVERAGRMRGSKATVSGTRNGDEDVTATRSAAASGGGNQRRENF